MIILDTNVLSALMAPALNPVTVHWLNSQSANRIWTTAVNVFESRSGIRLLPAGRRRQALELALDELLETIFNDRILPFDHEAAEAAAQLAGQRAAKGKNVGQRDTQIAGIAVSRAATIATRNAKDFDDLDIEVVDPWKA
ncbi:MAG: type II toxin-antitoxin system VapC family toxin [Rhizobiaceae bacterium]